MGYRVPPSLPLSENLMCGLMVPLCTHYSQIKHILKVLYHSRRSNPQSYVIYVKHILFPKYVGNTQVELFTTQGTYSLINSYSVANLFILAQLAILSNKPLEFQSLIRGTFFKFPMVPNIYLLSSMSSKYPNSTREFYGNLLSYRFLFLSSSNICFQNYNTIDLTLLSLNLQYLSQYREWNAN